MADDVAVDTVLIIAFFRSPVWPENIPIVVDLSSQHGVRVMVRAPLGPSSTESFRDFAVARSLSAAIMAVEECKRTSQREANDGRPLLSVYMSDGWSVLVTEVSPGAMSSRMRAQSFGKNSSWRELCTAR